jgi:hypothetical protein
MNNNKFHVMSSWTRNKTNKELAVGLGVYFVAF